MKKSILAALFVLALLPIRAQDDPKQEQARQIQRVQSLLEQAKESGDENMAELLTKVLENLQREGEERGDQDPWDSGDRWDDRDRQGDRGRADDRQRDWDDQERRKDWEDRDAWGDQERRGVPGDYPLRRDLQKERRGHQGFAGQSVGSDVLQAIFEIYWESVELEVSIWRDLAEDATETTGSDTKAGYLLRAQETVAEARGQMVEILERMFPEDNGAVPPEHRSDPDERE